jgi:hypothetical protein
MRKTPVILTVLFLLCAALYATGQRPERIIYKGTEYALFTDPLESYFTDDNPRPVKLFGNECTASRRGYIATWKVENGILYLVKVVAGDCSADPAEIDVTSIFRKNLPVEATWYSGTLRIPRGRLLKFINAGYASVYEEEILLTIDRGMLVREELKKNSKPE